jgi:hypothetical protein
MKRSKIRSGCMCETEYLLGKESIRKHGVALYGVSQISDNLIFGPLIRFRIRILSTS